MVKPSILLLTNTLEDSPSGGRQLLCKLNYRCLRTIFGDRLIVHELRVDGRVGLLHRLSAFRGHIDGLNKLSILSAFQTIRRFGIKQVFVDGSNLGEFVRLLKLTMPSVEIITFFHNVEARFFWGAFRVSPSFHSFGVFVANTLAEHKAINHSDKIICLSQRDSKLLNKLYRRYATHISPIALEDQPLCTFSESSFKPSERFALFVGGSFYANLQGIKWFVQEITPRINLPIYIVGRGFENMRAELERPGKVTVVGSVNSLADWYSHACFVIAPIFDGSGMKTKVAEALMHGKKVVCTPEAFSGYEQVAARVGWCCSSPTEFVAAINSACATVRSKFDPELRAIYEEKFSLSAQSARLAEVLGVSLDL